MTIILQGEKAPGSATTVSAEAATGDAEASSEDEDASWASEDDPDRLWCICKQPHNNR